MKKLKQLVLICLASLMSVASADGRPLTPAEALARLSEARLPWKAVSHIKSSGSPELKFTVHTPAGDPAVYLFANSDNTMMVIGANDVASPLLAYGLTPGEGEFPPQFIAWLNGYAADIAAADSLIASGAVVKRKVRVKKVSDREAIGPLLTTTWNQGNPYNSKCPEQDGQKSVTGCVATAFAQVLNYHKYPQKGKGEGHAWCNDIELTRSLEVTFEWDKMRDSYPGSAAPARATAVADLMVTCGFAVGMGYSPYGSGAYSGNVPPALVKYFSYDVSAQMLSRDRYTLDTWQDMLITELTENGPVYYAGHSKDGGHAFVCDGFDGENSFHFNWGWGGYCDGYFRIDDLEPSGQGIGGYEGGYNLGQTGVFNVHQPRRGSKRPDNTLVQGDDFNVLTPEGRVVKIEGFWFNDYYEQREFTFAFELENIETGEKIYQTLFGPSSLNGGHGYTSMQGELSPEYPDGTYELRVVSRTGSAKEWVRPLYNLQTQGFAYLSLRDGYPKVGMEGPELKVISATLNDTELKQNVAGSYSVELSNSFGYKYNLRLAVALLDEEGIEKATSKTARIIMEPDETKRYDNTFTIDYPSGFDFSKEYEVVLYDDRNKEIIHSFGNHRIEADLTSIVTAGTDSEEIAVRCDTNGHAAATAGDPIAYVRAYTPAGTPLNVPVDIKGNSATIDLSQIEGVVLVTVTTATGETATAKVVL